MNSEIISVSGFSYKLSSHLAMDEAKDGEYVLCLDEVRDNALLENKNRQVPIYYQWSVGNSCYGCKRILETTNPKLVENGVKKLQIF